MTDLFPGNDCDAESVEWWQENHHDCDGELTDDASVVCFACGSYDIIDSCPNCRKQFCRMCIHNWNHLSD